MFPSEERLSWERRAVLVAAGTEHPSLERRKHPRVVVHLPCRLALPWNALGPCVGVTENVSRNGLLIRWEGAEGIPQLPDIGATLVMALEWPVRGPSGQIFLWCWGRVVRVSLGAAGDARHVAMKVGRMSFRNALSLSAEAAHVC